MIAALLLSFSFAMICLWIGWRAQRAWWRNYSLAMRSARFDADLWLYALAPPALALFIWFGFLIFCLGRGYL